MAKITISLPDELEERLKKFPDINRSALFQRSLEREFEIRKRIAASKITIPIEKLEKIIEKFLEQSLYISYEFGNDILLDWIVENNNIRHVFSISEISDTAHIFDDLYKLLGKTLPIEEYETLIEKQGVSFDKNQFAMGFVASAKELSKILKERLIPQD